jgi:membrane protein
MKIWKWIKKMNWFFEKCRNDNIGAYAAQSAFFLILSLIPFLLLFSALLQYTVVSEAMLLTFVNDLMPEYIAPFVISIINEVYHKPVGIVSVTAVTAIWSSAKGVQHMAAGLNVIYGIKETRNWLVRRFWAVVYMAVFLLAVVAALVLLVFGNRIHGMLAGYVPLLASATDLLFRFRGIIVLGVMGCVFTVLYRTLPNNKEIEKGRLTLQNQFPGALLCAVAWNLFSVGISVYIDYFNGFSMYGSLTVIVLLMLWLYFGMYIMMLCAEVNVAVFGKGAKGIKKRLARIGRLK